MGSQAADGARGACYASPMGRSGRAFAALVLAAACSSGPPPLREQVRRAVTAHARGDAEATQDHVQALFARLDAEIARMQAASPAATKPGGGLSAWKALQNERYRLWTAFQVARVERGEGARGGAGKAPEPPGTDREKPS